MTVQTFLLILTACSFATSLITEAIKTTFTKFNLKYASNIIVAITGVIIGGVAMASYYAVAGIGYNTVTIIAMIAMIIANWLGATVGYDKVKQTIEQITSTFKGGKE